MPGLLPKTVVRVFQANMAKKKMDKWQTLDFQAKETQKLWDFVEQYFEQQIQKGSALDPAQHGSQCRRVTLAKLPEESFAFFASSSWSMEYLHLIWSYCIHWRGYFVLISSFIKIKKQFL